MSVCECVSVCACECVCECVCGALILTSQSLNETDLVSVLNKVNIVTLFSRDTRTLTSTNLLLTSQPYKK